jgi:hypothetical protein
VRRRGLIALALSLPLLAGEPPLKTRQPVQKPLEILNAMLHQREEGGPAAGPEHEFYPGELVHLSFKVANFHVEKDQVQIRYQLIGTDPAGVLLFEPVTGKVEGEVYDPDREKGWMPLVRQTISLPPMLESGEYHLKIRVNDEYGKSDAETVLTFRVSGRVMEPSETLVARKLHFYRSESDRTPLEPPVYHPGDSVWARFEIAGFQLGEKNHFQVEYGISVLRPSGKVLYTEPVAASEQDSPFYPKHLMIGGLSLNLTPDLPPGEYTIVLTVRDKVGAQEQDSRHAFKVEK